MTDKYIHPDSLAGMRERLRVLEAQKQLLKDFARFVIKQECWGYDVDGLGIQELAEKLGLIKEHIAAEDDVDEFTDFEVGDKIYKFADMLKGQDNEHI